MTSFSKTSLANRALDLVGKAPLLDLDTDTSPTGKALQRAYLPVLARCLRKAPWPFAIARMPLNPSSTSPVNEYSYLFDLPPDCLKLLRVYPSRMRYKLEGNQILCNEPAITVKYISNVIYNHPERMDPAFAEYFAYQLAVEVAYKFTNSTELKEELKASAEQLFKEAAALFSQEDVDDPTPESPWVEVRGIVDPWDGVPILADDWP